MKSNNLPLSISIIIAAIIIGGAIIYVNTHELSKTENNNTVSVEENISGDVDALRPIDDSDWVLGNRDAQIKIVEYTDTECPFCQRLHDVLKQIVDTYDGKVAWVYRNLPLSQLHSKAPTEAHALECAGELGGNDIFWKYTDTIYEKTPANNGLDLNLLPQFAIEVGLNKDAFQSCMDSGRHKKDIEDDFNNALELIGSRLGTPYNVIVLNEPLDDLTYNKVKPLADQINTQTKQTLIYISEDKTKISVNGAMPLEIWKGIIDSIVG